MGKYTPMIYEAQGWSLTANPVQPLEAVQKTVEIAAAQIATPPEIALSVRGGAGAAHVARFAPRWAAPRSMVRCRDGNRASRSRFRQTRSRLWKSAVCTIRIFFTFAGTPDWDPVLAKGPRTGRPHLHARSSGRHAELLFPGRRQRQARRGLNEDRPGDMRIVFGIFDDNGKTAPGRAWHVSQMAGPMASRRRSPTRRRPAKPSSSTLAFLAKRSSDRGSTTMAWALSSPRRYRDRPSLRSAPFRRPADSGQLFGHLRRPQ